MWRDVLSWKENIREFMKRIRQRPVRSGGSDRTDRTMWVVQSDEDGDGRTKMGTNPDTNNGSSTNDSWEVHIKSVVEAVRTHMLSFMMPQNSSTFLPPPSPIA